MNILSLDASTKSSGVALFNNLELVKYSCITSGSSDLIQRIHIMTDGIKKYLEENKIDKIILEEVRPEGSSANIKTQKALMYLQAAIVILVHDYFPKVEIEFVYPQSWRKKCGIKTGPHIKREQLKKEDTAYVNSKFQLNISNDDIADAICIGYAYALEHQSHSSFNWD